MRTRRRIRPLGFDFWKCTVSAVYPENLFLIKGIMLMIMSTVFT